MSDRLDIGDRLDDLEAENDALRDEVRTLTTLTDALRKRQRELITLLLGGPDELGTFHPDEVRDILQRVNDVEDGVDDVAKKVAIVERDGGSDTPDARAQRLRQVLYTKARKNDGKAKMSREAAETALGGGYHKSSVLEAMRRAADGHEADINGSSSLTPVDGITFHVGSEHKQQSRIDIDLADLTASEVRHNLTTQTTGSGGP